MLENKVAQAYQPWTYGATILYIALGLTKSSHPRRMMLESKVAFGNQPWKYGAIILVGKRGVLNTIPPIKNHTRMDTFFNNHVRLLIFYFNRSNNNDHILLHPNYQHKKGFSFVKSTIIIMKRSFSRDRTSCQH